MSVEFEVDVIGGARATDRGDEAQTEKAKGPKGGVQCINTLDESCTHRSRIEVNVNHSCDVVW